MAKITLRTKWGVGVAAAVAVAAAAAGVLAVLPVALRRAPDAETQAREKRAAPENMAYVPGGYYLSGTKDEDADDDRRPQKRVWVPSFYIDRTEVTNRQFKAFRPDYEYPAGEDAMPATNVTYDEAAAYAQWAGKRLPTGDEWEKAARGVDGRRYPWGDTWEKNRVASRRRKPVKSASASPAPKLVTTPLAPKTSSETKSCDAFPSRLQPVGSVPSGASPYGCLDMAGNAWEWVQGFYNNNPSMRILRGGAVGYGERACRTYYRAVEGAGAT